MNHSSIWRLFKSFITLKVTQLLIVYFTPSRFDTSSDLLIPKEQYNSITTEILNKLITWDSVYFNDIFINDIKYEHQFVFCPGWLNLIKLIPIGSTYYSKQILSIIISNICHFTSVITLYFILNNIFKNSKLSYLSSLMMIFSPAGIFLTTNYSENLCNLLTLLTLLCYYKSIDFNNITTRSNKRINNTLLYVLSGIICAYGFTVRANTLLLGILYLFDLYDFLVVDENLYKSLLPIFTGSILGFTFIGENLYHYLLFCPSRGEWCENYFPSLFQFAQDHYWNVGFLKYWTLNNIPNFLLVTPIIIWNCYSIFIFWRLLPQYKKLTSLSFIQIIMIFGGVFFWNIQILNRLTSYSPLIYWTLAINYNKIWFKYVLGYMITWNLVQTSLFAAFLPPA
ncbi:GPI18 [Candida pseudojiufengensis]|uniref:GPI18 n=1 Tax=Candida pseudojiufengensis TaxID=497109 RepID=UPI002225B17F|nr:GPI18 [Candida pseudojiufengensis]KAI5960342.1 GPI18 [Candida pseudojiufengensis]